MSWQAWGKAIVNMLAPLRCAGCDDAETTGLFCDICEIAVERVHPFFRPPQSVAALFQYGGPVRDALHRFKYQSRSDYGARFGYAMAMYAAGYQGDIDCVCSVPLHAKKLRTRGYNPASLMGVMLAKRLNVPFRCLLRRGHDTPSQTGQGLVDRQRNVRGAFEAKKPVNGLRVLMVDDVRTTGATLGEAGRALVDAGAGFIATYTLAYAEPRER